MRLPRLENPTTPAVNQGLTEDDASGRGFTLNLEATLSPPAPAAPPAKHKE